MHQTVPLCFEQWMKVVVKDILSASLCKDFIFLGKNLRGPEERGSDL